MTVLFGLLVGGQIAGACLLEGPASTVLVVTSVVTLLCLMNEVSDGAQDDTSDSDIELDPLVVPDCVVVRMPTKYEYCIGYPSEERVT